MAGAVRPPGAPRPWSSTSLMVDPTTAWDGTPTKVKPSNGVIDAGFLPTEQPPAERLNWLINDRDRRIAVLDMAEARTFPEPGDGAGIDNPGSGSTVGDFAFATFNQQPELYRATNATLVRKSVDGGYTWATDLTLAGGSVITSIASRDDGSKQGAVGAAYAVGGAAKIALTGAGGGISHGWASTTLTGSGTANTAKCIVADRDAGSIFLVGGSDQTGGIDAAKVWRVVDSFGLFSSQTVVAMAGIFAGTGNAVRLVAASPTYKFACQYNGGSNALWRWLDADSTSTSVTTPTTDEIRDLLWLPEDGRFLMISQSGGNVIKFWTSTDGATGSWSQVTTTGDGTSVWGNAVVQVRGACVRGSIIMVPTVYAGGSTLLMVSGDAGLSWEALPDPLARHQSQAPVPVTQIVRSVGPRFVAAGYIAASKVGMAYTMRAG